MSTLRKPSVLGLLLVFVAGGAGLMIAGCPAGGEPGPNEVFMRSIAFDPAEITISAGESVTWTNQDIVDHTATSGNPGDSDRGSVFRSVRLSQGGTFTHTFEEAGEFIYYCEVHPSMMRDAKVIVEP